MIVRINSDSKRLFGRRWTFKTTLQLAGITAAAKAFEELGGKGAMNRATPNERTNPPHESGTATGNQQHLEARAGHPTFGAIDVLQALCKGQGTVDTSVADGQLAQPVIPSQQRFGDYLIIKAIKEEGSFGRIDVAEDIALKRIVALKRLKAAPAGGDGGLSDEARAIAEIDHPNVVKINKYDKVGGVAFLDMEYMRGGSLQELLQQKLPSWREAALFARGIAEGVQSIHDCGIVHRDLKPANVLLDKGHQIPKVADFGLARRATSGRTQGVAGTPAFMPPEQFFGEATFQSDVWGLGATLYALLTGRPPFTGDEREIKEQARFTEPIRPRSFNRNIPRDVETICLKCLRKKPAERYASAREFAEDLDNLLNHRPIKARPTPVWERTLKWIRREPIQAALLVSSIVALLAFGVGGLAWASYLDSENRLLQKDLNEQRQLESARTSVVENLNAAKTHFGNAVGEKTDSELEQAKEKIDEAKNLIAQHRFEDLQPTFDLVSAPIYAALTTDKDRRRLEELATDFSRAYARLQFLKMPLSLLGVDEPESANHIAERKEALNQALQALADAAAITPAGRLLHEHPLVEPAVRERLQGAIDQILAEDGARSPRRIGLNSSCRGFRSARTFSHGAVLHVGS